MTPPDQSVRKVSIKRGIEFLLSRRSRDGWWLDFETLAGESDEWVTAYTGYCLAQVHGGESAAALALDRLLTRRRAAGWGYNSRVPADCDTTAWVCRLIELLGWTVLEDYVQAIDFLQTAIRPNGGVPTYPAEVEIRQFTRVLSEISFEGWTMAHPCVTANVASLRGLDQRDRLLSYLKSVRDPQNAWAGYWWTERAYPTMLAAEAIGIDEQSRHWAIHSEENSSFALACRARLGADVLDRLVELQQEDGGWPASAELRIPPPFVTDIARSKARTSLDHNRIYTTATAVLALYEHST